MIKEIANRYRFPTRLNDPNSVRGTKSNNYKRKKTFLKYIVTEYLFVLNTFYIYGILRSVTRPFVNSIVIISFSVFIS